MNLNAGGPQQLHGNQAQNRRPQQKGELYSHQSQSLSQKGPPVRLAKNTNGSGKGQKTLNSAKETQNASGNNSKISTPGHLMSAGGIQNQKTKSSVLDQIVQMQSQTSNLNNNATLSQQLNHQQISQRRGTTPVRPPAKNQLTQVANVTTAVHGSGGLPLNPLLAANNGSSKGNARGKQQYSSTSQQKKQKIPADLQINRLMAAANAQAQANPNIQKQLKNQNLFPNQSQMPSNQMLLATLQGTDGIEAKQYAMGQKQEGKHRQGAESASGYQYRSEQPQLYENLALGEDTLQNDLQNLASTNFDLNIAAQRSHEQNWDSRGGHGVQLFDPVTEEPTPDHLAARTSSEYVNTDEEEEVEGYERRKTAEKPKAGDHIDGQDNQYMQHNMHPLKNSVKSKPSNRQKSEERKSYGKQVLQNDLEVAHANQNLLLLRDQYSQVAAEKDYNGSGSQSRKKSRSQNKRTDTNLVFQTQVLQQQRDVLAAGGGAQYTQNGGSTTKGAHPVKAVGARQRGQSVSHANNGKISQNEGGTANRSGKQSASIDRKLEVKHQKSQQAKNLKNNLSQQMSNVAKIAQETKSLKTIQYNPIGLTMCPASQQVQNQIISPQPVPSQTLIFKQHQQSQMESVQNPNGGLPSDPQPQIGNQGVGGGVQLDFGQLQQTLQQLSRVEQIQVQLSRRVDIFEEEIIKRVREIQKYSKGLNQIIRKNVIPKQDETDKKLKSIDNKIEQVNQKVEMPARENAVDTDGEQAPAAGTIVDSTGKLQEQQQAIFETQDQMEKLLRMFEEQNLQIQQLQEQGDVEIQVQEKVQEAMGQCQQLAEQQDMSTQQMNEHVKIINQIQEKLAEQNQLISIFDDQITNQEEKLENMAKSQTEISNQVKEIAQEQNQNQMKPSSPAKSSKTNNNGDLEMQMPDIDEMTQKVYESIVNSDQIQKVVEHEEMLQQWDQKMKDLEMLVLKIQEDGEGRDGLILQQNQDITNLFSANEQILGNEKTFKEHHEKLDAQLSDLIAQIEEADWQNSAQVEERVQVLCGEQLAKFNQNKDQKIENESQQPKEQLSARSENSSKQLEQLRVNLETRMMLSIETVKRDISMTMAQNQAQLTQSIENVQKKSEQHDLVIDKIPQDQHDLAIVQEQVQNLELQMQAQFDEWVTEQDKSFQDKFNQMNHLLQQQQNSDLVSKDVIAEIQKDIEEQIAATQANIDKVVVMQQSSLNPLHAKIQDLQVEIGQKVVEVSQQQDNQISQLVEEIKQISDNLENMQEIVVQCNSDAQTFKTQTGQQFDHVMQEIGNVQEMQAEAQNQIQAQAQGLAQVQAQAQQPSAPSIDPAQLAQITNELKEHRQDISELSSDLTNLKIDLQKIRQTSQGRKEDNSSESLGPEVARQVAEAEGRIAERVRGEVAAEVKAVREDVTAAVTAAVMAKVEGQVVGVKDDVEGLKKWTEQTVKALKVDELEKKIKAIEEKAARLASNSQASGDKSQKEAIDQVSKQVQELSNENKAQIQKVDEMVQKFKQVLQTEEQTQSDLLTMKNIVSYMQDSNYQAQIDGIKKDLQSGALIQNRFSLPEPMKSSQAGPISQRDSLPISSAVGGEEIENIVMAKKPAKKAQQVRSSNPMAVKKAQPPSEQQEAQQEELEPEKMMMAGNATAAEPEPKKVEIPPLDTNLPQKEEVKAKKLELSPIFKDPQLASSRDGRDTERDNMLLQRIGLQSAKKSDKEAFDQQYQQPSEDKLPMDNSLPENSQNVIQELENQFQVNLDDMEDDLMARIKKDKSSFLPDDDDSEERYVEDIEVDLNNQEAKRPSQQLAERPSDFSLPGFLDDKDDPVDAPAATQENEPIQHEEEQYSDEFETMEKAKEDLVIEDQTNKYVEYSASALTMSAIKLEDMSTDQLADEVMKLINFGAFVDSDVAVLLSTVVDRRQ